MTPKEQIKQLNKTVWCKLAPSKIHKGGIGLIAIRDIPKGTTICQGDSTFYQLTEEEMNKYKLKKAIKHLILDRNQSSNIFQSPNMDMQHQAFMNHSNTPNSNGWSSNQLIKKGDEITENYFSFGYINEYAKQQITKQTICAQK
jgi:hypothetical protein